MICRIVFADEEEIYATSQSTASQVLLGYIHRRLFGVVTIEISAGGISRISIVTNPDKLSRLLLPASTC